MQATTEELRALLQLQKADMEKLRVEKALDGLPQRAIILEARKKKAAVQEKSAAVEALHKQATQKVTRARDEDAQLAAKEDAAQRAIEDAAGDYRSVEARTKELDGFAKRRAALAEKLAKLEAEAAKVEAVAGQVEAALAAVEAQEADAIASFQREGGALKAEEAQLVAQREQAAGALSPTLLQTYEKTAKRAGGVAVGLLTEGKCGSCRTRIEGGRLIDLKSQAPLGTCPNCKRLLIVM